jgi:hypothetical protein
MKQLIIFFIAITTILTAISLLENKDEDFC